MFLSEDLNLRDQAESTDVDLNPLRCDGANARYDIAKPIYDNPAKDELPIGSRIFAVYDWFIDRNTHKTSAIPPHLFHFVRCPSDCPPTHCDPMGTTQDLKTPELLIAEYMRS